MNILVTGGAGFIGSALVDRMLAEGHQVEVVDDLSAGTLSNLQDARRDSGGNLRLHQCDITDDGFVDVVVRRQPEVIFHLARCTDRTDHPSVARRAEIDVVGTVEVLEGARRAGVRKVVMAASVRATTRTSMASIVREQAVELVLEHRTLHGTECTVIDLPTVFGPRQRCGAESSVVACFAERMVRGQPVVLHGSGEQTRDLLFVDDAVDALVRAATAGDGLRIAVGTGTQTSVRSLVRAMAAIMGSEAEPVAGPARPDEPGAVVVDPARSEMYLGWRPFTPLAEALTDTLVSAES